MTLKITARKSKVVSIEERKIIINLPNRVSQSLFEISRVMKRSRSTMHGIVNRYELRKRNEKQWIIIPKHGYEKLLSDLHIIRLIKNKDG